MKYTSILAELMASWRQVNHSIDILEFPILQSVISLEKLCCARQFTLSVEVDTSRAPRGENSQEAEAENKQKTRRHQFVIAWAFNKRPS